MSFRRRTLGTALVCGLLLTLAGCGRPSSERISEDLEFAANLLTDATYVHTRLGDYYAGYLVRCEINYTPRRIFIAMELPKYEKGERLRVEGTFAEDSVRMSYGDQLNENYPLFIVRRAKIDIGEKGMAPLLGMPPPRR
ncbi:MAG: hypothetical protein ABFD80_00590 [Acidobacteriota bacterium]